jgi:hypothetical protein
MGNPSADGFRLFSALLQVLPIGSGPYAPAASDVRDARSAMPAPQGAASLCCFALPVWNIRALAGCYIREGKRARTTRQLFCCAECTSNLHHKVAQTAQDLGELERGRRDAVLACQSKPYVTHGVPAADPAQALTRPRHPAQTSTRPRHPAQASRHHRALPLLYTASQRAFFE